MPRATEIERKFLVRTEWLPPLSPGTRMRQAYLGVEPTVRVRVEESPEGGRRGVLTIKGSGLVGREEFEYEIPAEEAEALLRLSPWSVVAKTRHRLPVAAPGEPGAALAWEIDVFEGENAGLVLAEIELPAPDFPFPRPEWLGEEVSRDPAYKNAALARQPYRRRMRP